MKNGPSSTISRLREKRDLWNQHLDRAKRTLVVETEPGVVTVIVSPDMPEWFEKATDPEKGPDFLRGLGVSDPSTVKVMADVTGAMPPEWTADDESALAKAEATAETSS